MPLLISFVLWLKELIEGFMVMSLRHYHRATRVDGVTHGQELTGMGSDGVIEVVS